MLARKICRVLGDTDNTQGPRSHSKAGKTTIPEDGIEVNRREEDFNTAISRMNHAAIREYWFVYPADGLLRHSQRLYIPPNDGARSYVLRRLHDDPLAGHFGYSKTLELIRRRYWWPHMARDIKQYDSTCTTCQMIRPARHKPYGELTSLPDAEGPWLHLTMDFITGLPPNARKGRAYDSILVIVDWYSKWSKYIPVSVHITADELAEILVRKVVLRMSAGYPKSIVSDRGSVFTAKFWSALCYHLKIRRNLSTAFHPQTDGQTERQNQTLEQYLRSYINYQQDDWISWLPMAEFAYNNMEHAFTGVSPFFAMTGRHLRIEEDLAPKLKKGIADIPAARERATQIQEMRNVLQDRWKEAVKTQAHYHDGKTTPRTYRVGDKVWLSGKHIRTTRPSKKLDHKFHGPFVVDARVGTQAYRLKLPQDWKIHPVFQVSLLEAYRSDRRSKDDEHPPPELVDDEEEWELEAILDSKSGFDGIQYYVKWKGYSNVRDRGDGSKPNGAEEP